MVLKVIKLTDVSLENAALALGPPLKRPTLFPLGEKGLSLFWGPGQLVVSKF